MRFILSIILSACALTLTQAQTINFVNKSVCAPEYLEQGELNNYYVQGSGHNVYLSYPLEAQEGSFSDQVYEPGTEENPLVIYEVPDSLKDDVDIIAFQEEDRDADEYIDQGDNFVDAGVWEYREDLNMNRFQGEGYEEVESRVWTCVAKEREGEQFD